MKKCWVRGFKGTGDHIGYGLVYKSGLAFFLTAITKKLAIYSTVQYSTPVLNICKILTLVLSVGLECWS